MKTKVKSKKKISNVLKVGKNVYVVDGAWVGHRGVITALGGRGVWIKTNGKAYLKELFAFKKNVRLDR